MSLPDAAHAVRTLLKVLDEAHDMVSAGAVGSVLHDTLRHASDLLDIVDEELCGVDATANPALIAAAPLLRAKLEQLWRELPRKNAQ
jgi:hypothetical protein